MNEVDGLPGITELLMVVSFTPSSIVLYIVWFMVVYIELLASIDEFNLDMVDVWRSD